MREGQRLGRALPGELQHEVIGMHRHRLEFSYDQGSVIKRCWARCSDAPQTGHDHRLDRCSGQAQPLVVYPYCPGDVVAVAHRALLGVARHHQLAPGIAQAPGEEMHALSSRAVMLMVVGGEPILHGLPCRLVHDRGMLAFMDLPLVPELTDVEGIAQQLVQMPA